ncbi:MAG: DUF2306 domain-containing protein [Vicinamibacterales bacterium]
MPHILLTVHIVAGFVSLGSMLFPLLSRKGGALHRRTGWVFVGGMTVVSLTAFSLAATRWLTDPTENGRTAGGFLLFVSLLTASGVSAGVRVLRFKSRTTVHWHPWDIGLAASLFLASVAMAAWSFTGGPTVVVAYSVIGLLSGGSQLAYWLRPPVHPKHWWLEHMAAMGGSCIAATTAFLVVNAIQLGFGPLAPLAWIAPTLVGAPLISYRARAYRREWSAGGQSRPRRVDASAAAPGAH